MLLSDNDVWAFAAFGDINNDGVVNSKDLAAATDVMNGLEPYPSDWSCIDMDTDGNLDQADLSAISSVISLPANIANYCCQGEWETCGGTNGVCCARDALNNTMYCGAGYCCPTGTYFKEGKCEEAEECGISSHINAMEYCPYRPFNDPAGEQVSWWSDDPWCIRQTPLRESCCYNAIKYGEPDYYDWTPISTY